MSGIARRGRGASLSRLGHFGGSHAEGVARRREPVPAAAVRVAAAQEPAAAAAQYGPAVLDSRQSMVRRLARFASYCEARNGSEVASTGLACLLVLAIKSGAVVERVGPEVLGMLRNHTMGDNRTASVILPTDR